MLKLPTSILTLYFFVATNQTLYSVISTIGLSCMSYWGTNDKSIRPLSLKERQPFLLLQGKHDDGQSEDQRLSRTGEGYANHVSTWQTTNNKHRQFKSLHALNIHYIFSCLFI